MMIRDMNCIILATRKELTFLVLIKIRTYERSVSMSDNNDYEKDKNLIDDNNISDHGNESQEASNGFILMNEQDNNTENTETESGYLHWVENGNQPEREDTTYRYSYMDNHEKKENIDYNHMENKKSYKKKKGNSFMKTIVAAILFGVVAGLSFQGITYITSQLNPKAQMITENENQAQIDKNNALSSTAVVSGIEGKNDVSDVVDKTMPSIVSITSTVTQSFQDFFGNQYDKDAQGSGSGIIVGKNEKELLIVTNNHVITDSKSIKVTFINNTVLDAQIKGTDQTADLAVVAVNISQIDQKTLDAIKVADLGNSEETKVGEMSIAIGNALGYGQSVTVGYISAKDRKVSVDEKSMTLLQTDAAINPGNSGGALLNVEGEVIGINSVKYASSEVEGMGYAIPISKAVPIINELMNREVIKEGDEGYLGITGRSVTAEMASMYKMPVGAYVIEVLEDSAASKAGILSGDIITKVNEMEASSMESVKEKVNSYPAGTKLTVTIQRRNGAEYEEKELEVVLQKMDSKANVNENKAQEEEQPTVPFGYDFDD